ncbi:MAG: DUF3168 domain-containing protein [Devosia sp.]|uniref:DUF3168 domain-containing protein n=1 Tax=Devosia sp. TaxID=1871048 RepID=UPI0024C5E671|nr:DUF3168 domain-containing protein [Devosia sp.]UYN99700.1 MAG: DUF3168 domain-containing protein [Devosia sp.]
MHPMVILQTALVEALLADTALTTMVGANGVFDTPPKGRAAPYVVIDRHDMRIVDVDLAPGQEHGVVLHCWSAQPSRKAALAMAARVVAVGLSIAPAGLTISVARHLSTETVIDKTSGQARAAVTLRFLSE